MSIAHSFIPRQNKRGVELIEALAGLLQNSPIHTGAHNGCQSRDVMRSGRTATEKEQDSLLKSDSDAGDVLDLSNKPNADNFGKGAGVGQTRTQSGQASRAQTLTVLKQLWLNS